jgi:hypothetical protein
LYDTGNKAMVAQGEWRRKYEEKTQELRKAVQKYEKLKLEGALQRQNVTPQTAFRMTD